MHPAKEGFSALPFFDEFDLSTVDILLISQYVDCSLPSDTLLSRQQSWMLHHTPEGPRGRRHFRALAAVCGGPFFFSDTGPRSMYMSHTIQYIPAVNFMFLDCILILVLARWRPQTTWHPRFYWLF
jgi:hypothetical protein